MNYELGQIFEGVYPPEAAEWCNLSQGTDEPCAIEEIESIDNHRRFMIVSTKPTETARNQARINELQSYLDSTDWYVARFAETGIEIPEEIKRQRQEAREEISRLRQNAIPVSL